MPPFVRWLAPAVAILLAVGAGYYVLPRWVHPDPVPRAADGFDWAALSDKFSDEGFDRPMGPWRLELPGDHGGHPNARAETWNLSVHLRDAQGEDIGVQFALQRFGLVSPDAPERESPWELRAIYRAHVTLLDGAEDAAVGEERFQRDVPGVAGHDAALREVWLDNWTIRYGKGDAGDQMSLDAAVGQVELRLLLTPAKAAVALNPNGSAAPFRGYSITRIVADGFIGTGDDRRSVSGLAWLDHAWGDLPLPVGPIVLDRLQLQLDDLVDLSVTRTRRRDGRGTPTLAAYAVGPNGAVEVLAGASLEMETSRTWRSDAIGARFPIGWRIRAGELQLKVAPIANDQLHDFVAPLWSGVVTVEGVSGDRPVSGRGTLLLTGDAIR
jgi:predicted secreted hydrolase